MTQQRAEQIIVIALVVLLASTVGGTLAEGKLTGTKQQRQKDYGKKIVGGFFTILFASLVAEAAPEVGAGLAVSVAGYAFFKDGLPAINAHYPKTATSTKSNASSTAQTVATTAAGELI